MDINARKEQFSNAFVLAIAAVAGCSAAKPTVDNDSIDWTISNRLPRRPKVDLQLKCTSGDAGGGEYMSYPLKRKNYDDLIVTDLISPRILVLVTVPDDIQDWMLLSAEELVLRHGAYWLNLMGQPPTENETNITVHVPRTQVFKVESLKALMERANQGVRL